MTIERLFISIFIIFTISCSASKVNNISLASSDQVKIIQPIDPETRIELLPLHEHQTVWVDNLFTPREVEIIYQSAQEWRFATNGRIQFTFYYFIPLEDRAVRDRAPKNTLIKISSSDPFVHKLDIKQQRNTLGFLHQTETSFYYMGIVWDRIVTEAQFHAVILHEMGHSLGLVHDDSSHQIMNSGVGSEHRCLQRADLINFCLRYGCNETQVNWCSSDGAWSSNIR